MTTDHERLQASPFLRLPRELRDRVYDNLLDHALQRPEAPSESDDRIEEDQGWGSNYYEPVIPIPPCRGVLSCNRQTSEEMQEAIARKNANSEEGIQYKLDLIIWENSMQPTWLSLPTTAQYVKSVQVDVRMIGHYGPQWIGEQPPILAQYLLQMLRRFFENGPQLVKRHPHDRNTRAKHDLHLDSLIIHFVQTDKELVQGEIVPRRKEEMLDLVLHKDPRQIDWDRRVSNQEQCALWKLRDLLAKIAKSGLLFNKTRSLKLVCGDELEQWTIKDKGDISVAIKKWEPFGWGPILEITQKQIDHGDLVFKPIMDCVPR